ncbi:macrophage mannose receptor 1-like [Brachionichthys hirsutus]|uniref:macrophage mannose receptor 1-like n=1 Tax=Brachionichthys hirsutus TaxID=412623 RepID=UPI0036043C92
MDHWSIIFVLTALVHLGSAQTRQYIFVNEARTWTEAQSFCRTRYNDLATIFNRDEFIAVARLTTDREYSGMDFEGSGITHSGFIDLYSDDETSGTTAASVWIGLHLDFIKGWTWSLNDSTFYGPGEAEFKNWFPGQLESPEEPSCVGLFSDSQHKGAWLGSRCHIRRPFVCYSGGIDGAPLFVKEDIFLPWNDAQEYCRRNHVDLASIRNLQENDIIANLAAGDTVWIGLHGGGVWSDGSTSTFRCWADGEPNSVTGRCVAVLPGEFGLWSNEDCSLRFPFICYSSAPLNPDGFQSIGQNQTSVTLQWNTVNNNVSFILQFNGRETNIAVPNEGGTVTHTVSDLTAGTQHTFTLFSVFENIRSSGVSITAVTGKMIPFFSLCVTMFKTVALDA